MQRHLERLSKHITRARCCLAQSQPLQRQHDEQMADVTPPCTSVDHVQRLGALRKHGHATSIESSGLSEEVQVCSALIDEAEAWPRKQLLRRYTRRRRAFRQLPPCCRVLPRPQQRRQQPLLRITEDIGEHPQFASMTLRTVTRAGNEDDAEVCNHQGSGSSRNSHTS